MYWTNNLAGGQPVIPCAEGSMPWDFDLDAMVGVYGAELIDGLKINKKSRSVFMTNPETRWNVYLCAEALDPNSRPSKDNPVVAITGLVGDFDTKLLETYVDNARKLNLPPNWIEQSLSGNFRVVWAFEKRLGVTGPEHARAILDKLSKHVKMQKIAPALDKNSFNPAQTWTNGGAWLKIADAPLPADLLTGLAIEALKGLRGDGLVDGVVTDLKAMADALAAKFPKFSNWPGEFSLEGQGPTFWLDSNSPKSAIVKPWGMFTFADGAPKAAYSWSELVGREIADTIVAKKMTEAASEIYFDGMRYFLRTSTRTWSGYAVDPVKRNLKIEHGISSVAGPEGYSQLDEALHAAEQMNRVSAVAPCIPFPQGIVEVNGNRFLNSWVDLSIKPASGEWSGKFGDGFPNIAEHISHMLTHPDAPKEPQATRFLDWLSVFYRSILRHEPQSGQALFLLGGAGVGKGMLSGIIQTLVGGGTRAEDLLTGRSAFGGECYDQPLMCVDDLAGLESRKEVLKFTENLKARVANATGQNFHKKHQTPASIPWFGRIFITMNDDDNSMSVLPDFSSSVEDKIGLLHAAPTQSKFAAMFATLHQKSAIIRQEAPAFARYLLAHYDAMPQDRRDSRYGTKAYHFSLLRDEIADTQALGTLAEPLREFFMAHFEANPDRNWEGRASSLFRELQGSGLIGSGSAYPHANVNKLGRQLRREEARNRQAVYGRRYPNSKESATWVVTRSFIGDTK